MAQSIDDIISDVIRERLQYADIDGIMVERVEDSEGDPILNITVVFASDMDKLDTNDLVSLGLRIRPKLEEQGETRFPMFRFISKADDDWLRHEAA